MNINHDDQTNDAPEQSGVFDIRHLSVEQLAKLGVEKLAYVKPIVIEGTPGFAIHAADGTPMALVSDRDMAIAAIIQHEMVPALVH